MEDTSKERKQPAPPVNVERDRFTVHQMPGPDDQDPGRALFTGTNGACLSVIRMLIYDKGWNADNIALIDDTSGRYASWAVKR